MATHAAQDWHHTISSSPYALLQPTLSLHTDFLHLAKQFLDPLASDITAAQTERQKQERTTRKRKRKQAPNGEEKEELLRMRKVYVEGFDADQVWQQAKKVLGAAAVEVERVLPNTDGELSGDDEEEETPRQVKSVRFDEDGFELGVSDDESLEHDADEAEVEDDDTMMNGEAENDTDLDEEESLDEDGHLDGDNTPLSEYSDDAAEEEQQKALVTDKFGLNDGFFSIDDFNKQTQFMENQDSRGDPNDGAASDEEDIDWEANPLTIAPVIAGPSRGERQGRQQSARKADMDEEEEEADEDDEEDEGEGDGPTFGDMDLDAPSGASDDDEDGTNEDGLLGGDFANTNQVLYADFFAPPAKKPSKKKQPYRPRPKADTTTPVAFEDRQDDDDEVARTMAAVQRDLLDDAFSEASGAEEDVNPGDPAARSKAKLSTHERAQVALRAEIRKLEAANVASKPWYLSGEAVAATRPVNSLLEEDLDFERAGKPVPVITEEVSESIEDLIKRRILAREFDEVIRRRPDDLATGAEGRRGRVREELADTKPTQGLAAEYEAEHLRRTDPNFVDTRTEALKATHSEIEASWAKISAQLDGLSNWHYKPKPPGASLEVRVNAPVVSLEDARPSAGGEVGGASLLAPQELYRPGEEGRVEGEVVTRGGTVVAKEEETREARRRRRAREKERKKKAEGSKEVKAAGIARDGKNAVGGKKARKEDVVAQLKKGGARVIDSKGGLRDVEGNVVKEGVAATGASSFKL